MRTSKEKYDSMIERGRSQSQVRAVAIARGDNELLEYVKGKISEGQSMLS